MFQSVGDIRDEIPGFRIGKPVIHEPAFGNGPVGIDGRDVVISRRRSVLTAQQTRGREEQPGRRGLGRRN